MTHPIKHRSRPLTLALAVALALGGLAACGDDDPVAEAAAHMCACEKVSEPGTDVGACQTELEAALSPASASTCVTCINQNAASSANDTTCSTMAAACANACGF